MKAIAVNAASIEPSETIRKIASTTPKAVETRVYRARKFLLEWLSKAGFVALLAGFSGRL